MAPSEPRKFFKVILNSTLQRGKMKITKPFAKEQGSKLPQTVRLSIPTGQSWNVRIERESKNTVWFLDGLDKFLEDNCIGNGYILVFKYDGSSRFGVQIFDLTASEIVYTCIDNSVHGDDSSVECLGSSKNHLFPRKPARRGVLDGTNNVERCYSMRGRKQVMACGAEEEGSMPLPREGGDANEDNVKVNHNRKKSTTYIDDGTDTSPGDIGKEITIESENESSPNFFKVTMRSVYLRNYLLNVPTEFARLHMAHSTMFIKLVDYEDNEWAVRYIHRRYTNILSSGWRRFVRDKKLMVGDVCIFERLWGGDEVKLRVTISRRGKHQN